MRRKTRDEVLASFEAAHGATYCYSGVVYVDSKTKVSITCKQHGDFQQTPYAHARGSGCPVCGARRTGASNRLPYASFIVQARIKHGDKYDYDDASYMYLTHTMRIRCGKHGWFTQSPSDHIAGKGCNVCGHEAAARKLSMTFKDFCVRAKAVHKDRYTYHEQPLNRSSDKVRIDCPTHGLFTQQAMSHLSGRGCPQCKRDKLASALRLTDDELLTRFREVHDDKFDYSQTKLSNMRSCIDVVCPEHGVFMVTAEAHARGAGCKQCGSAHVSEAENEVAAWLDELGIEYRQSVRGLIGGRRELDFVVPSHKLAIEFNGNIWHSSWAGKDRTYHLSKLEAAQASGIRCIMIRDDEWREKKPIVQSMLRHALGMTKKKVFARKCVVRDICHKDFAAFADSNHLQGRVAASEYIGLFYEEALVCAIAVRTTCGTHDMVRFVTLLDTVVCGGLSKLVRHFGRPLHTFCERRLFAGAGYEAAGAAMVNTTPPDMSYTNGTEVRHRRMFQKKRAATWMAAYDMALTEAENAANNGWYQLFGCGLIKYVFNA